MEVKVLMHLLTLFTTVTHTSAAKSATQKMILELLSPNRYDKTERPCMETDDESLSSVTKNSSHKSDTYFCRTKGEPVRVKVDMQLNRISSVSEALMEYTVDIFLRQRWTDDRLRDRGINKSLVLTYQYDKLWVPDLFFSNLKSGSFHVITQPNRFIQLSPDGTLLYGQRLTLTLGCDMNLQSFPWDTQICEIRLESYGHTVEDIIFEWNNNTKPIQADPEKLNLPEFKFIGSDVDTCAAEITTGSFTCLKAQVVLERQTGYYMAQTYIPSILIVILSWVSFWIDIHAVPARVSVGLLTVLTLTTQSSGISNRLPRVSYVKAIDVWMSVCLGFVFGALIEYSIVNVLARLPRSSSAQKVGEPIKSNNRRQEAPPASESEGCSTCFHFADQCWATRLDITARFMFPVAFVIFNLVYWFYYVVPKQR